MVDYCQNFFLAELGQLLFFFGQNTVETLFLVEQSKNMIRVEMVRTHQACWSKRVTLSQDGQIHVLLVKQPQA